MEVAQIMEQLKQQPWDSANKSVCCVQGCIRNPAGALQVGVSQQLHVFDAPLADVANQITVDISDQVTQLERWQERELHVCSFTKYTVEEDACRSRCVCRLRNP